MKVVMFRETIDVNEVCELFFCSLCFYQEPNGAIYLFFSFFFLICFYEIIMNFCDFLPCLTLKFEARQPLIIFHIEFLLIKIKRFEGIESKQQQKITLEK